MPQTFFQNLMLPTTQPSLSTASGVPFVLPASGTVNNTSGNITTGTAFDYVIGPSYTFFPLGALYTNSPAGWYYMVWTAATIGTVYADMYTAGVPAIPDTPTPLTTVAGAYTQATGFDVFGPTYSIPPQYMGKNGFIEWNRVINNNNSAGAKTYNVYFGGQLAQGAAQTTNPKAAAQGTVKNRGRANAQISANAAFGDNGNASTLPKLTVNTQLVSTFSFAVQLATATDYAILESHLVRVTQG
jgi:hypothetical protein